jgi:hypothetical protein
MQMIIRRAVVAFGAALTVATSACSGESPTNAAVVPANARFDGGITFGSGNLTGASNTENTTAADSGSTARGGITFGSGN